MARTWYQRGDASNSDCTPATDVNKPLQTSQTGGNETVSATVAQGDMNAIEISFSTASGDPGGPEDLGASSQFRCQLDVTAAGSNLTYIVEFHALDNTCTSQGSVQQTEGAFSSTGLKLATATWDPPSAHRYQARVLCTHGGMHNDPNETLTLRTNNSNAFFEVPDLPVAGGLPGYTQSRGGWW